MSKLFDHSRDFLERALNTIPLGSQTFSKSYKSIPLGSGPLFVERAKGSHFWDVDGNEFIDFVSGLLCVLLGYQDADVDQAVVRQMQQGVTFSLPHRLEMEVAELIVDMVPCAEMVRFGKNGSDATAGAIRLARAYTGRDYVAVCGYHGWQDWYIGSTSRDLGVPEATKALTLKFEYNNIASLERLFAQKPNKIAAVILEPMNVAYPEDDFLDKIKAIAHKNNAVLIFDEIITGFRFAKGGAQELFGVTPDLVTMGKGVANGYPLSFIAGKKEIMQLMEEIFFSFTFGGETLSLAAAKTVMQKIQNEPVIETLRKHGEQLISQLRSIIVELGLQQCIQVNGHPSWSLLGLNDYAGYSLWQIKTFLLKSLLESGVFVLGSHNLNYAHTKQDIEKLLKAYHEALGQLRHRCDRQDLDKHLGEHVLEPLFAVR